MASDLVSDIVSDMAREWPVICMWHDTTSVEHLGAT